MKSTLLIAAFVVAGFLVYFLLRSSAGPAPRVRQPQQKAAVAKPDTSPKTENKKSDAPVKTP